MSEFWDVESPKKVVIVEKWGYGNRFVIFPSWNSEGKKKKKKNRGGKDQPQDPFADSMAQVKKM